MMTERKITRETVEWLKTKNPLRSTLLDFEMAALRTEYPEMLINLDNGVVVIGGKEKENVAKVAAYIANEFSTDGKVYAPSDVIISDAVSKFFAGLGMNSDVAFKYFSKTQETIKNYKHIWTQIAEAFKNYDDYLMFESLNEEACWGDVYNQWSGTDNGKKEVFDYTNQLNQAFVDVIRSSGGNNPERHLLLAGYCTDLALTCDPLFKMPYDPINRCAVSIHYYTPSTFCILTEDADWGKAQSTWGTNDEIRELNNNFDKVKSTFIDKGIPVIIGEYGAATKNKDYDSVKNFLYSVCKACYSRNILPVLWDVTGEFYDRNAHAMKDSALKDMLNSVKN